MVVEGLAISQDGIDLPGLSVGRALDPELVLPGVTARRVTLIDARQAGPGEPLLLGIDGIGVADLDAEMVQAAALPRVLQQNELERRLGDGEVGVAGTALGGLGSEQLAVKRDGLLDVIDVEGELHAGHENLLNLRLRWLSISDPCG